MELGDPSVGARNLLVNCASLTEGETLVIISENPDLGWYDREICNVLALAARDMGIKTTVLNVGPPTNKKNSAVINAINKHDCALFLARIGDQGRFADPIPNKKIIMCYARDTQMLASSYGQVDHNALLKLKTAVNNILLNTKHVRITCALGTEISGDVSKSNHETLSDVSIRRFPLGVPQPLDASGLSGRVALTNFLTPTGSKMYDPPYIKIEGVVFAEVLNGNIIGFEGSSSDVDRITRHYAMVSKKFGIRGEIVHSFHAGIHPGCHYFSSAEADPDRWSNTVFTNPRVLHFHTCGEYAPGEICWMIIDPTVSMDGRNLWQNGHLMTDKFMETKTCVSAWPILGALFSAPSSAIGLDG